MHRDWHHRNLLVRGETVTAVIDWEAARAGDARLDLVLLNYWCDVYVGSGVSREAHERVSSFTAARVEPDARRLLAALVALHQLWFVCAWRPERLEETVTQVRGAAGPLLDLNRSPCRGDIAGRRTRVGGDGMTRLVLTNANLLDGDAPAQANRVVVIDGDRIASVGDAPPADVTAADRVVDLGGRTVMPGMITCHYHSTYRELGAAPAPYGLEHAPAYQVLIAADNLRTALECGFTGAVGAGCSNDIDASMKRAIDDGLIPGPRFVPSGHELSTTGHANDGNPWYWDLREWGAARCCDGPDEFRAAVRDEIKRGVEMVKLFVTGGHGVMAPKARMEMTRDELDAVVSAAHARDAGCAVTS